MEIIKGHSLIFHHFFFQTSGDFGITCKLFFFSNFTDEKYYKKTKQNKTNQTMYI